MKALLLVLVSMATALAMQGQGYFNFNNLAASGTITIPAGGYVGEGNAGDYVGSTYDAALYYSLTPISGSVDPSTLTLAAGSTTAFFGTTGSLPNHGPSADGAGLFDGGTVTITGTADGQTIYAEVAVWYAAGGAVSYAAALASGQNTGFSSAIPIRLASGTDNTIGDMSGLSSFLVGEIIPEPATIALGALGGAALLLFRRRK